MNVDKIKGRGEVQLPTKSQGSTQWLKIIELEIFSKLLGQRFFFFAASLIGLKSNLAVGSVRDLALQFMKVKITKVTFIEYLFANVLELRFLSLFVFLKPAYMYMLVSCSEESLAKFAISCTYKSHPYSAHIQVMHKEHCLQDTHSRLGYRACL